MCKLIQFSFIFCLISFSSFAQVDKYDLVSADKSFYLLINDSLLFEKDFVIEKKGWFKKPYDLTGKEIRVRDLKFSGFDSKLYGYYHYKGLGMTNQPISAVRKELGEIDLYIDTRRDADGGTSKSYYYSKRFEGLKPLKRKFLMIDLISDSGPNFEQRNVLILEHLEKGKRKRIISLAMLGAGLATFMVGASGYDKNENASNLGVSIVGMGIMVGGIAVKHRKHYLDAVRTYNRF